MSKIMRNGVEYTGGASAWSGTQAEYNALPVKDSTTIYFITDASIDGHNYSTDEQIVGTWIDGTTNVYEKVCTGTTNTDTAQVLVSGVDKIISATGHAGVYGFPAPYLDNNRKYIAVLISNGDAKVYTLGSNYAGLTYEIVLRYIKTST